MNYYVDFRKIYRYNDYSAVSVSLIANTVLVYLISRKTTQEMSLYKQILLQTCFVDSLLTIAFAVAEPIVTFKYGNEYIVNNGFFRHISSKVDYACTVFWIYGLVFSYCSISVQFVYRYFTLVRQMRLTGLKFLSLFIIPTVVNTIHVILTASMAYPTEEKLARAIQDVGEYFLEDPNSTDITIGWIGFSSRPDTWFVAFDMFVLTAGSYTVIIWCNIKIWFHLKDKMQYATQAVRDMNSQINKTLIAQAIVPLAVNGLPMLIFLYCIVSRTDMVIMSLWVGLPLTWMPVVNPVLTIWFVKPYRDALFNRKQQVQPETTPGVLTASNNAQQSRTDHNDVFVIKVESRVPVTSPQSSVSSMISM